MHPLVLARTLRVAFREELAIESARLSLRARYAVRRLAKKIAGAFDRAPGAPSNPMTTTDKLSCEDLNDNLLGAEYALYCDEQPGLEDDVLFNAYLDEQAALSDAADRTTV